MDVRNAMKEALSTSKEWADKLVEDISDEESMVRGNDGLNHIKWLTGHLCVSTRMIACGLGSEPQFDEVDRYSKLFDWNTSPLSDARSYPTLAEIMKHYDRFHRAALEAIDGLADDDLGKEIEIMDGWKAETGKFVIGLAQHQAYHVGQIADVRSKVLGRKGLFG